MKTVHACDYLNLHEECFSLTNLLKTHLAYIDDLISNLGVKSINDEDNCIKELSPYWDENIDLVQSTVRKISSYSDRLASKVDALKRLFD